MLECHFAALQGVHHDYLEAYRLSKCVFVREVILIIVALPTWHTMPPSLEMGEGKNFKNIDLIFTYAAKRVQINFSHSSSTFAALALSTLLHRGCQCVLCLAEECIQPVKASFHSHSKLLIVEVATFNLSSKVDY